MWLTRNLCVCGCWNSDYEKQQWQPVQRTFLLLFVDDSRQNFVSIKNLQITIMYICRLDEGKWYFLSELVPSDISPLRPAYKLHLSFSIKTYHYRHYSVSIVGCKIACWKYCNMLNDVTFSMALNTRADEHKQKQCFRYVKKNDIFKRQLSLVSNLMERS